MARLIIKTVLEDIKKFRNMIPYRKQVIAQAKYKPLPETYKVNNLAESLHPQNVKAIISSVDKLGENAKIITLTAKGGKRLPFFRAGQGINVKMGSYSTYFPILSSPKELEYKILVYKDLTDKVTELLYESKVLSEIDISGPCGFFYFSGLRDSENLVFISDFYGVAPILSICKDIKETKKDVKVKVFVYSKVVVDELTQMFSLVGTDICFALSSDNLIKKIKEKSFDKSTVFISGKETFCEKMNIMVNKKLPLKGRVRFYVADPSQNNEPADGIFKCKVYYRGSCKEFNCKESETLLVAFEQNDVPSQAKCKNGECGYCRCKLVKGEVEFCRVLEIDSKRSADEKYGFIHPCRTYPKSDLIIDL